MGYPVKAFVGIRVVLGRDSFVVGANVGFAEETDNFEAL